MEEPSAKDLYPGTFSRHAAEYKRRLDEVMARSESRGRAAVIDWVDPSRATCRPMAKSWGSTWRQA
ncbi:MAG: hypothetical protein E6J07_07150 [Chloroflexi bacterium]|nr:MAG: hypothetical protein E6J07_07150 [Chloroflexota bacterium]